MTTSKRLWPTPIANDAEKRGTPKVGAGLAGAVHQPKFWPTPTSNDSLNAGYQKGKGKGVYLTLPGATGSASLPPGSRVRTSATPARAPVSLASAQDYGPSSPEFLARYDPIMQSSKTSPLSPAAQTWWTAQTDLFTSRGLELYSETWPRSGMTVNGTAYQLPPLVRLTAGTGGGALPTPRASDAERGIRGELNHMAKGETPRGPPTPHGMMTHNQGPSGNELGFAVNRMWTTPMSHKSGRDRSKPDCLPRQAHTQDATGSLNPAWVCWLMGYPEGWLDAIDGPKIPIRKFHGSRKVSPTENTS